ncbi:MAG: FlgD immunoglobulin-like domain containing protein [Candidatus Eisenbacteria bacterium]
MLRFLTLLILVLPVSVSGSVSVSEISVTVPFFSPNNDGVQDLTGISFKVGSDRDTVYVWISVTDQQDNPVKTLAEAEAREPGGVYKLWDGTDASGAAVSEGIYSFDIVAMANSDSDGPYSAGVVLDRTAPNFTTLIYPSPYVPGLPFADSILTVEITAIDTEPDDWLSLWIMNQALPETLCTTQLIHGDATYACTWDGREEADGTYELFVRVRDRAGNSNQASYSIKLDARGPVVEFTYPEKAWLDSVPTSVAGWVFDQSDVDSIGLRFSQDSEYLPVNIMSAGDTLIWNVEWPEDLRHGGTFNLGCYAGDSIGYETVKTFVVYVDTTIPVTPVFDALDRVSSADVTMRGTSSPSDSVFVYLIRPGASEKSAGVLCNAAGRFQADFELGIGRNLFRAFARDRAGNESDWSDTAIVVYDETVGITVPEKLDPGARIDVNLTRPASEVILSIFSVDGYHIVTKTWQPNDLYSEFEWDLKDADNKDVRNGLYLLVFQVSFADGGQSVEKRVVVISR